MQCDINLQTEFNINLSKINKFDFIKEFFLFT